jgi:multiple antibiotic resistance protein
MSVLTEALSYVFGAVIALLPIVNPFSVIGMVLAITSDLTPQEREQQIRRACIYMFFILAAFLVGGSLIMKFFGISLPGLRISGGLIVAYLGFRMLFPDQPSLSAPERSEAMEKEDVSFTPLAMPGLSGPGSIALVVSLSARLQQGSDIVAAHLLVIVGIGITALISYLVLRSATRLHRMLGTTGINAVARLMGFLLVCIGVQFAINGILEIVAGARS